MPSKEKLLNSRPKTNGPTIIPVTIYPVTLGSFKILTNRVENKAHIKTNAT